jgi:hypothetical protein
MTIRAIETLKRRVTVRRSMFRNVVTLAAGHAKLELDLERDSLEGGKKKAGIHPPCHLQYMVPQGACGKPEM